jgi:molybdopterin-guanine dinucleotide biosynthesis protein A
LPKAIQQENQSEKPPCGAVILSGGRNSRMAGYNKAFLDVGGNTILDRLLTRLTPYFEEVLLVTRHPDVYSNTPVRVVADIHPARSSLTGIHAGLTHIRAEFAFVVPCDTPFLMPAVIELLMDNLESDCDVVVPHVEGHYEPLCAIYSKRCLPLIAAQLNQGDFTIYNFFDRVNVKRLPREQIKQADPELISFFNVNTPAAHAKCRELVQKM